eukprot:496629-Lingulodinium_polyedra.AAC.1
MSFLVADKEQHTVLVESYAVGLQLLVNGMTGEYKFLKNATKLTFNSEGQGFVTTASGQSTWLSDLFQLAVGFAADHHFICETNKDSITMDEFKKKTAFKYVAHELLEVQPGASKKLGMKVFKLPIYYLGCRLLWQLRDIQDSTSKCMLLIEGCKH